MKCKILRNVKYRGKYYEIGDEIELGDPNSNLIKDGYVEAIEVKPEPVKAQLEPTETKPVKPEKKKKGKKAKK